MSVAEMNWRKEKERDAIPFPKTKTNHFCLKSFMRNSAVVQQVNSDFLLSQLTVEFFQNIL